MPFALVDNSVRHREIEKGISMMIKTNHDLAVEFHASAATHVGLVRKSNQDRYFVGRLQCREECVETDVDFSGEVGFKPGDHRFNFAPGGGSLLIVADAGFPVSVVALRLECIRRNKHFA